jgi:hypothetical protein
MSCFVDFVILCSMLVGTGQDEPGDSTKERDLMESDLGTEDNEVNEDQSNSLSLVVSQPSLCPHLRHKFPCKLASVNPKS